MTPSIPRDLPLAGSLRRPLAWLFALAIALPTLIVLGSFIATLARISFRPALLTAPVAALAVAGLAFVWTRLRIRRIAVTLDDDALTVNTGFATRRYALAGLRAGGVQQIDLAEHIELRPLLRTWGLGLPGLDAGWFRLRNGDKALVIVTTRERVTVLRADDGTRILLALADTEPLRTALA